MNADKLVLLLIYTLLGHVHIFTYLDFHANIYIKRCMFSPAFIER
jgi:hypothetical protein